MPCYKPRQVWKPKTGRILFRGAPGATETTIPCGWCIGCRLDRTKQWATRCVHEAQLHEENSFITLTYDEAKLPENGQLVYRDFQLFMKRFREKTNARIRFYMAGEYGSKDGRPHFHACIFGYAFPDKYPWKTGQKHTIYRSAELESLWTDGFSSVGTLTPESAAYVAGYVQKKIIGPKAQAHYTRFNPLTGEWYELTPEFNKMSTHPGIGAEWLSRYQTDVYPHDFVMLGDERQKTPAYYDKLLEREKPELFEEIKKARKLQAYLQPEDARPKKRNDDKQACAEARAKLKERKI